MSRVQSAEEGRARHFARLRAQEHLEVGGYRAEVLGWGSYPCEPWRNWLHVHSSFEVCYAYSGRGVFRTGEAVHTVGDGDVFVARPGDVHEIVSELDDPLGIYFWRYTLARRRRAGRDPGAEDPEGQGDVGADRLLWAYAESDRVLGRITPALRGLLTALAEEGRRGDAASPAAVRALAVALVLETARSVVDPSVPGPADQPRFSGDRTDDLIRTMTAYLHDNMDRPVTVRDLAAQVHLSERHTARMFRRATGTTVRGYLAGVRLETAAGRLLEPDTTIAGVARSCGYPDVRYFTTAFRHRYGVTPGAFRTGGGTVQLTAHGAPET